MNTRFKSFVLVILLFVSVGATAQDISITSFYRTTSVEASMSPEYYSGKPCGLVRFHTRNAKTLKVESNLGVIKTIREENMVKVYLPQGRQKITLSCGRWIPLTNYQLPEEIEGKTTYDAVVEMTELALAEEERTVYAGLGFNVVSIMGPSVVVGVSLNHHNVELGGVLGLNKSDELFFYSSDGTLLSGFNYKAFRAYARYGYEVPLTSFLNMVPQAGVAVNFINGSKVNDIAVSNANYMKSASSVSALVALRFVAELNSHFKIQLTPEYDFGIAKNNNCKRLNEASSTIKQWTDGLNLNVGVMAYF